MLVETQLFFLCLFDLRHLDISNDGLSKLVIQKKKKKNGIDFQDGSYGSHQEFLIRMIFFQVLSQLDFWLSG